MRSLMALLLDLANILGGFLLAIGLLRQLPGVGDNLRRFADRLGPFGWVIGIVALVAGGFYLIVHLSEGDVYHFELIGIGVGLALLWDRITGRARAAAPARTAPPGSEYPATRTATGSGTGVALLLGVFGIIAIVVGLQGLFTPD